MGSNTQAAADESGSDGQASLGLMLGKWQADDTGCGCDITLHSLWHFSAPQFPPPHTHSAPGTSLPSACPLPVPALIFSAMTSEDSLLPPACPLYIPSILQIYSFGVFGQWSCLLGRIQHNTPPAVEIFTCRRASAPCLSSLLGELCKHAVPREHLPPG